MWNNHAVCVEMLHFIVFYLHYIFLYKLRSLSCESRFIVRNLSNGETIWLHKWDDFGYSVGALSVSDSRYKKK